jgi:hypothetical protein
MEKAFTKLFLTWERGSRASEAQVCWLTMLDPQEKRSTGEIQQPINHWTWQQKNRQNAS